MWYGLAFYLNRDTQYTGINGMLCVNRTLLPPSSPLSLVFSRPFCLFVKNPRQLDFKSIKSIFFPLSRSCFKIYIFFSLNKKKKKKIAWSTAQSIHWANFNRWQKFTVPLNEILWGFWDQGSRLNFRRRQKCIKIPTKNWLCYFKNLEFHWIATCVCVCVIINHWVFHCKIRRNALGLKIDCVKLHINYIIVNINVNVHIWERPLGMLSLTLYTIVLMENKTI